MSKGVKENTEIIPPPALSHLTYPFNYSYGLVHVLVAKTDTFTDTARTLQ